MAKKTSTVVQSVSIFNVPLIDVDFLRVTKNGVISIKKIRVKRPKRGK